jgi:hypothetical protein
MIPSDDRVYRREFRFESYIIRYSGMPHTSLEASGVKVELLVAKIGCYVKTHHECS